MYISVAVFKKSTILVFYVDEALIKIIHFHLNNKFCEYFALDKNKKNNQWMLKKKQFNLKKFSLGLFLFPPLL